MELRGHDRCTREGAAMNETRPNHQQLRALDDLRRLDRAIKARGNQLILVTEALDDTLPDIEVPE